MAELLRQFPKCSLGYFPTPITELTRLTSFLNGPKVFVKRDDHTGLAFGGNKIRKLEFLCGHALSLQSDTVVTAGAIQSNHCRLTAAAAARLGLGCHLLLGGHEPAKNDVNGNLLLDYLLGVEIHWTGDKRKGEDLELICEELRRKDKKPYMIPYGGSNQIGALGYVSAMIETMTQLKEMNLSIDAIIFPTSSGGTQAGLLVGAAITNFKGKLIGIRIDKDPHLGSSFGAHVAELSRLTADFCGAKTTEEEQIEIDERYLGGGYAVIGDLEREAITMLARNEGILVDPVYTGRAMGGLINMIRQKEFGKDQNVLFLHTGGHPALFAYNKELII